MRTPGAVGIRPNGGRGGKTCSLNGFYISSPLKMVFLSPRKSKLSKTRAETTCNARYIGLVKHPRCVGGEIWRPKAVAPQILLFLRTISLFGPFLAFASRESALDVRVGGYNFGAILVGPICLGCNTKNAHPGPYFSDLQPCGVPMGPSQNMAGKSQTQCLRPPRAVR